MDISYNFKQIARRPDEGGFVSILKQVPNTLIFSIEVTGIPCHHASHEAWQIPFPAVEDEMEMIGKEGPCQAEGIELFLVNEHPVPQLAPVLFV
jgi:hypothetical protein